MADIKSEINANMLMDDYDGEQNIFYFIFKS
jgi:hypothetical protein